jgi:hypothetical protein
MLTRAASAEVRACDEDRRGCVLRLVEHEVRLIGAPRVEQPVLEAGASDPLEIDRRDDLVGVDVAPPQRHRGADMNRELVHQAS